jgi:20S proteasome alpha/beta subunit
LETSHFAALGCGSSLATFILSEQYTAEDALGAYAVAAAVYVVEKVKSADAYCGGPTKVGVLRSNTAADIPPQKQISGVVDELARLEQGVSTQPSHRMSKKNVGFTF